MQLRREDLARAAVKSFRAATEWPHYSIFLAIRPYGTMVIAPPGIMHGDLFLILRQDWRRSNDDDLTLGRDDVFDGHIEWEDDGNFQLRTQRGESVPEDIDQVMTATLNQFLTEEP